MTKVLLLRISSREPPWAVTVEQLVAKVMAPTRRRAAETDVRFIIFTSLLAVMKQFAEG
jgi:hypothetical protein